MKDELVSYIEHLINEIRENLHALVPATYQQLFISHLGI